MKLKSPSTVFNKVFQAPTPSRPPLVDLAISSLGLPFSGLASQNVPWGPKQAPPKPDVRRSGFFSCPLGEPTARNGAVLSQAPYVRALLPGFVPLPMTWPFPLLRQCPLPHSYLRPEQQILSLRPVLWQVISLPNALLSEAVMTVQALASIPTRTPARHGGPRWESSEAKKSKFLSWAMGNCQGFGGAAGTQEVLARR